MNIYFRKIYIFFVTQTFSVKNYISEGIYFLHFHLYFSLQERFFFSKKHFHYKTFFPYKTFFSTNNVYFVKNTNIFSKNNFFST